MFQQGQVLRVRRRGKDGSPHWAYRYRVGGRGSKRVQRGGFKSEQAAIEALERALERLRRERGLVEAPPLRALVEIYLAQHDGEPETVAKLRWLLAKAVGSFGHRRISHLRPAEIAAWRMTIPAGHRFEATQALRQVLARAVSWGLIDVNPAKQGVNNPQPRLHVDASPADGASQHLPERLRRQEAMPGGDNHPPGRDLGRAKMADSTVAESAKRLREEPVELLDRLRLAVVLSEVNLDELAQLRRLDQALLTPKPPERPSERLGRRLL